MRPLLAHAMPTTLQPSIQLTVKVPTNENPPCVLLWAFRKVTTLQTLPILRAHSSETTSPLQFGVSNVEQVLFPMHILDSGFFQ